MLKIAICDDLPKAAVAAYAAAQAYFSRHSEWEATLSVHHNPLIFLESLEKTGGVDVLILDVCMPGIDGTQVAAELRDRGDKSEIIFVTTSDEFAVEAFSLKAAHYLVKPFTEAQFTEAMDRALAHFTAEQAKKVSIKRSGGGIRTLDVDEILWIESFDHTQTFFLKGGGIEEVRESLSQLLSTLEELVPGQFASPCKGYIVNQNAIRTVEPKSIVMRCGQNIPLARGGFRKFSDQYFAYQFYGGVHR